MPIYEYACPDCGHRFEHLQKMRDPLLTECPSCGRDQLRKLVSITSFNLKGSGWYRDHYGLKPGASSSKAGSSEPGSSKAGASKAGSSGASSSEGKGAAASSGGSGSKAVTD